MSRDAVYVELGVVGKEIYRCVRRACDDAFGCSGGFVEFVVACRRRGGEGGAEVVVCEFDWGVGTGEEGDDGGAYESDEVVSLGVGVGGEVYGC